MDFTQLMRENDGKIPADLESDYWETEPASQPSQEALAEHGDAYARDIQEGSLAGLTDAAALNRADFLLADRSPRLFEVRRSDA